MPRNEAHSVSIGKGRNTYEVCEKFVINKLQNLKNERKLSSFCKQHKINYNTCSMFLNKRLKTDAPYFIRDCLNAFGYKVTGIHKDFFLDIAFD